MATIDCPKGDGSKCPIPGPTSLRIEDGTVRKMQRSERDALARILEDQPDVRLRSIDFRVPELVIEEIELSDPELSEALRRSNEEVTGDSVGPQSAVFVKCSPCGDIWVWET